MCGLVGTDSLEVGVYIWTEAGGCELVGREVGDALTVEGGFEMFESQSVLQDVGGRRCHGGVIFGLNGVALLEDRFCERGSGEEEGGKCVLHIEGCE